MKVRRAPFGLYAVFDLLEVQPEGSEDFHAASDFSLTVNVAFERDGLLYTRLLQLATGCAEPSLSQVMELWNNPDKVFCVGRHPLINAPAAVAECLAKLFVDEFNEEVAHATKH